ncbi:MAG: DUF3885 domain-containing protein [Thiolinea sp.]
MMNKSIQPTIRSIFGEEAFEHGLFYVHDESLRFELSGGGESYIESFQQAYTKALLILETTFRRSPDLRACISFYGGKTLVSNLSVFKGLSACEIGIPKNYCEAWRTAVEDEEDYYRHFITFPANRSLMRRLVWSATARDLGVRPSASCDVYLYSIKSEILAHPYDDRGMDIIGRNKALKQQLYQQYHDDLLRYDLAEMERHYGAS